MSESIPALKIMYEIIDKLSNSRKNKHRVNSTLEDLYSYLISLNEIKNIKNFLIFTDILKKRNEN